MTFVSAIFKFIAKNPPSILILGGILFILVAALMIPVNPDGAKLLIDWAPWLIGLGVILQILWLIFRGRRSYSYSSNIGRSKGGYNK